MDKKAFWQRINALIKAKNTTQQAIANETDVKYQTFRQMSATNTIPRTDVTYKIAQALGVSVEYLLTGNSTNPAEVELQELKDKIKNLSNSL